MLPEAILHVLRHAVRDLDSLVAARSESRSLRQDHAPHRLVSLKVDPHSLDQLAEGVLLAVENEILDRHERVDDVSQTDAGRARRIVPCAALRDIETLLDAVRSHRRHERSRTQHCVRLAQQIVVFAGQISQALQLYEEGLKELIESLEVCDLTRLRPHAPAHQRMIAVVQSHLERRYHVEHHAVGVADVLARDSRLDASGRRPVAQILRSVAEVDQRRHYSLVVVDRRSRSRVHVYLAQPAQVSLAVLRSVVARVDVRVPHAEHLGDLQEDVSHVVDRILALWSNAAESDRLVGRASAEEVIADIRDQRHVVLAAQIEASEQLYHVRDVRVLLLLRLQLRHIGNKERLQPLVHSAERESRVGALHVDAHPVDPDSLNGLFHVARRELRRVRHSLGDDLELLLSLRIGLCRRLLARLLSEVSRVRDHALVAEDHCLELVLLIF